MTAGARSTEIDWLTGALIALEPWQALLVFGGIPLLIVLLIALPFYARTWWAVVTRRRRHGGTEGNDSG